MMLLPKRQQSLMTTTTIDPRLRARRGAVHRAEGRRRLRFVLLGLAVLGLLFGGWAVLHSPLLDLDHIEINGLDPLRLAEIEEVLDLEKGTALNAIDTAPIKARLEALPWVLTVSVAKAWPNRVQIEVIERVAVARMTKGNIGNSRVAVLDATGTVMAEGGSQHATLPLISYDADARLGQVEADALAGLALIEVLPDDLYVWVEKITYTPGNSAEARGVIGLDLVGSAEANLGEATLLADKVEALRTVLAGVDLSCIRTIDVAVPDFPTIRRDPRCNS